MGSLLQRPDVGGLILDIASAAFGLPCRWALEHQLDENVASDDLKLVDAARRPRSRYSRPSQIQVTLEFVTCHKGSSEACKS